MFSVFRVSFQLTINMFLPDCVAFTLSSVLENWCLKISKKIKRLFYGEISCYEVKRPIARMTDTSAQSGIFWGIGVLWELGHFDKHQPPTRERKGQHFSPGNYYKNFILNEKFYQQMTTIRAFFLQIRALFPIFEKRTGETSPL